MKLKKELMGASTSLLILGILTKSPNYGYQIVKHLNEETEDIFTWQEGTIYPVLHKMEKEGFISTEWQEAESGRQRKYYFITEAGRAFLKESAKEWKGFYDIITKLAEETNG